MLPEPENLEVFMMDVKELHVEVNEDAYMPEWFQIEFANLIHEMIKTHILEMEIWHQLVGDSPSEDAKEEEQENGEYINWANISKINHFAISGSVKYEDKTKVSIQLFVSRRDSIKFSNNYKYNIDNIIENMDKVILEIRNFILRSCEKEEDNNISVNYQQYYPEVIKILESHKTDQLMKKLFITGLFYAKAGNKEKALENLEKVVANSSNTDMVQECYKLILSVKAKKNMKDLENAQKEIYQGDSNKAIPLIESLIQITPRYMHLHFLLGMACKRGGQGERAIESFRKTIELDSNHVPALRELAEELIAVANLTEAEALYRKIIQLEEANAADYYSLGMCLKRMGRTEELDYIMDKIKELDTEGRLDSYLFSLFEIRPDHFAEKKSEKKQSIWSRLFSKR